jgi:Uma2 family endonuclease
MTIEDHAMHSSVRFTTSDLEGLPSIDGVRYEIIDGDLYVAKSPDWHHQYVCAQLLLGLQLWSRQTAAGVALPAPGIIFAPDDNVVPDVVWISRSRFAHVWDDRGHLRAAPDLAVEVLSPGAENEHRDRELKLKLYSRHGVLEYWIVDWQLRLIQVHRREEAVLTLIQTLNRADVLTSPLLPGFACSLADLWEPIL